MSKSAAELWRLLTSVSQGNGALLMTAQVVRCTCQRHTVLQLRPSPRSYGAENEEEWQ